MQHLIVPLSFLLGAIAGGLLIRYWLSRGDTPKLVTRRQKLKLVAVTAFATTLLIAVTGYAIFRYKFRKSEVSRASTGQAVADYRKAHGGAAQDQSAGTPPGGVYTYKTKGFLKVKSALLGNELRPLPDTIPAVLIPKKKRCWELKLMIYDQNHRGELYCKDEAKGLRIMERWETNEMFGVKTLTRQSCRPPSLIGPTGRPGSTWRTTWKVTKHETTMPLPMVRPDLHLKLTYLDRARLEIGGREVWAHHLRQQASYTGPMKGTLDREVWYATDTGMMLKLHVKSLGKGMASMEIDRQYTLASLTPKK